MNRCTHQVITGFGSPTKRHSIITLGESSDCCIIGRSVNVALVPSSGTGASSPEFYKNPKT